MHLPDSLAFLFLRACPELSRTSSFLPPQTHESQSASSRTSSLWTASPRSTSHRSSQRTRSLKQRS